MCMCLHGCHRLYLYWCKESLTRIWSWKILACSLLIVFVFTQCAKKIFPHLHLPRTSTSFNLWLQKMLDEILLLAIEKSMHVRVCVSTRVCMYVCEFEHAENPVGTYHFLSDVLVLWALHCSLMDSKFWMSRKCRSSSTCVCLQNPCTIIGEGFTECEGVGSRWSDRAVQTGGPSVVWTQLEFCPLLCSLSLMSTWPTVAAQPMSVT